MKKCYKCQLLKPIHEMEAHYQKGRTFYNRCKLCARTRSREARQQERLRLLQILGNKCKNCGITDIRVLQVDHINGGGVQELKAITPSGVYRKALKDQIGYQLLCANCNWIKRHENNEVNPQIK